MRSNDLDQKFHKTTTIKKNKDTVIKQFVDDLKNNKVYISSFSGLRDAEPSLEENIRVHFCIGERGTETGDVALCFKKNGAAHLRYDASETKEILELIYAGDIETVEAFVKRFPEIVDTPIIDQNSKTGVIKIISYPVIEAIFAEQTEIGMLLLCQGWDLLTSSGMTPLDASMVMRNHTVSYYLMNKIDGQSRTEMLIDAITKKSL